MGSVTYAWETAPTSTIDGPVVSLTHFYTYILIYIYMSTIYIHIYTYIYIFHASPGYRIERPKRVVSHYQTEGPENGKNSDTLGCHILHTPQKTLTHRSKNKERKGTNKQAIHSLIGLTFGWSGMVSRLMMSPA